jgi:hypothetical protein
MPGASRRPGIGTGPEIKTGHRHAASCETESKLTRARADFQQWFAGTQERRQSAFEPAMIPDNLVRQTEVATIVQRIGMVGGKRIEQLGLKGALHAGDKGMSVSVPLLTVEDCPAALTCPEFAA